MGRRLASRTEAHTKNASTYTQVRWLMVKKHSKLGSRALLTDALLMHAHPANSRM